MKLETKLQARKLRQEQGLSIKKIASLLQISLSSASNWVRDIELSSAQKETLLQQNPAFNRQVAGNFKKSAMCREKRERYQQEGREKARERDPLHMFACMLYWAEGTKSRSHVQFANSDPHMIRLFSRFLCETMSVPHEKIALCSHVYLNNGLNLEAVENYWLKISGLPDTCLRKSTVNVQPTSSKGLKKNKLLYGVCHLSTGNVRVMQHIYGAIQEYAEFENSTYLDLVR